jgi:hypothetical protein
MLSMTETILSLFGLAAAVVLATDMVMIRDKDMLQTWLS